jgi:hypothetical protein
MISSIVGRLVSSQAYVEHTEDVYIINLKHSIGLRVLHR